MSGTVDVETLPSAWVDFVVVSDKVTALEWHAFRLRAPIKRSRGGIAVSPLIEMSISDVSQTEFVPLLDRFSDALLEVVAELGGEKGIREHVAAEVRLTIFANDNINASVYLPRKLIDAVSRYGLDLYFSS